MLFSKMCKEEVQEKWVPKVGDYVMSANNGIEGIVVHRIDNSIVVLTPQENTCYFTTKFNLVWLPTQSQLQEMLFPNNYFWYYMGLNFLNKKLAEVYGIFYSGGGFKNGEEFWIAVVMWELYRKIWDICMEKWIRSGK